MTTQIILGDVREALRTLPDKSVHMCLTSPPYYGMRSYLPKDHPRKHLEIGSERTVQDWVANLVDVFREVRRVLRDDGTVWLNVGDSYAGSRCGGDTGKTGLQGSTAGQEQSKIARRHQAFTSDQKNASANAKQTMTASRRRDGHPVPRSDTRMPGFKPKDLVGQPWMLAFALRDDGWHLRQEIIFAKRNPMPESARDRFTKAHETVFLLSKKRHYYFDFEAIQEPASVATHARMAQNVAGQNGSLRANGGEQSVRAIDLRPFKAGGRADRDLKSGERLGRVPGWRKLAAHGSGIKSNESFASSPQQVTELRNPRNVFFADEDEYLQFLAWKANQRVAPDVWQMSTQPFKGAHFATFPLELCEKPILAGCPVGGTVLDIFGGSGTTGLVADRLHRNSILIDIDERNVPMARDRISADAKIFADIAVREVAA